MDVFEIDTMKDGDTQKLHFLLTVNHYSDFFELDKMAKFRADTDFENLHTEFCTTWHRYYW